MSGKDWSWQFVIVPKALDKDSTEPEVPWVPYSHDELEYY